MLTDTLLPKNCFTANQLDSEPERLSSLLIELDNFFHGGLPFGRIIEIGAPIGQEGRNILLPFLVNATQGLQKHPMWALWINGHENLSVFPPAFYAAGIHSKRLVFTQSTQPGHDLRQIFLKPYFQIIVLDSPKKLSLQDYKLLKRQTIEFGHMVIILRNSFLTQTHGNINAQLRLNAWVDRRTSEIQIDQLKGHRGQNKNLTPLKLLKGRNHVFDPTMH